MRKLVLYLFFTLAFSWANAQQLSLDSCQARARKNHPLLKQAGIIDEISALRQQNIDVSDLPQFDLTARASWQSDVTKMVLNIPGVSGPQPLSKDQYKAYVDIRQKLYDGGASKKRKELEEADRLVLKQQNETELYKIRETVNSLYINALIFQENLKIVDLKKETLDARIKNVSSSVRNGVTLPNDLDQLKAEKLMTQQQEIEFNTLRKSSLSVLGILTGDTISEKIVLTKPSFSSITGDTALQRPELLLFTLQKAKLGKSSELLSTLRKPFVFAFGQVGYGRPGFNMLDNSFADYYMLGAGLTWNLWDWHKTRRDKASIKLQQNFIDTNLEQFNRSINILLNQEEYNFRRIIGLINTDEQLVTNKEQISKRSAVALENGTITSADYIRDLNGSLQAKSNLETHKVLLMQASLNYLNINGNK
jgi:outer membrane protein TolC